MNHCDFITSHFTTSINCITDLTGRLVGVWVTKHFRFVWNGNEIKFIKKSIFKFDNFQNHSRCSTTVFSDSPRAFFPTHLYSPKSDGSKGRTINFIVTLNTFSIVKDSYVPPWTYSLLCNQKLTEFGCDSNGWEGHYVNVWCVTGNIETSLLPVTHSSRTLCPYAE